VTRGPYRPSRKPAAVVSAVVAAVGLLVVAAFLLSRPAMSAAVLVPWAATAFLVAGITQLLLASRARALRAVAGGMWLTVALVVLVWPSPTTAVLSRLVASGLLVVGVIDLILAVRSPRTSDVRFAGVAGGCSHLGLGVAVLVWPSLSPFSLGVVLSLWLLLLAPHVLVQAAHRRHAAHHSEGVIPGRTSTVARMAGSSVMLLVVGLVVATAVIIERDTTPDPGPFYASPEAFDERPGALLRVEAIDDFVDGADAYRVLYTSRGMQGEPVAKSGVVVVPQGGVVPPGGRPVLAHTHGTIGIDRSCAPSLLGDGHAAQLWGLEEFLAAGWIVAAPDYLGLGGEGDHPYLVGEVAAHGTLDMVRAAVDLAEGEASTRFAVAGHSQGGHAALFTGERAAQDAPELDLVAVAALAPASDLPAFIEANDGTILGNLLGAYAVSAWDRTFDDIDATDIVDPVALPILERLATTCLAPGPELASLLVQAELLKLAFLLSPIWETEPWASRIVANTPGQQRIDAPLLVVQGDRDSLIRADIQRDFTDRLCAAGQVLEYREITGAGHLDVDHKARDLVVPWLTDRLAGVEVAATCTVD